LYVFLCLCSDPHFNLCALVPKFFSVPTSVSKGSCVEGLVPSAVLRGGAFGKWLDYKGYDLISELIHCWIHNLMIILGGFGDSEVSPSWRRVTGGMHWKGCLLPTPYCFPFLCFLGFHWVRNFTLPCPSCLDILPCHRPLWWDLTTLEWSLKPWVELNISYF
jgi:hypothetical protein